MTPSPQTQKGKTPHADSWDAPITRESKPNHLLTKEAENPWAVCQAKNNTVEDADLEDIRNAAHVTLNDRIISDLHNIIATETL